MSKQDLIKEWCEALENGNYKQGYRRLQQIEQDKSTSYCCLGVLCNIVQPNAWKKSFDYYLHNDQRCVPLENITDLVGLNKEQVEELYSMNDCMEYTFKDISNYIKDNFLNDSTESN